MRYWNIKDKMIVCSGEQASYFPYTEMEGYSFKGKNIIYPLTLENILKILKFSPKGKKDVYQPAFIQACLDVYERSKLDKGRQKFLSKLTLSNIDTYLPLIKHKEPPPFKNQRITLEWIRRYDSHALLHEMGTGKTRTAIEGFWVKKNQGKVDKCLVICPVSMLEKWVDEVEKWTDFTGIALTGSRQNKIDCLQEDYDFYTINFESCRSLEAELLGLIDFNWMIIVDEFTRIKNFAAKRSKSINKLGKLTDYKLILSGTPITQHAYDAFNPFLFLDNGRTFGLNYDRFISEYYWREGYKYIPKHGTLKTISNKIYKQATRFRKEECIDIPPKMYDIRKITLSPEIIDVYNKMVQWCITQIENQKENSGVVRAPIILVQLLKLSQITSGFVVDENGDITDFEQQPKVDALIDIFDEAGLMNGNEDKNKIIVWTRFQHDVENIMNKCNELNIKAVSLYGLDSPEQRNRNIKSFQNDSNTTVIVGTASTGGLGIELTAGNIVVYYSNSYSLEQRLQSEDRPHRAGQTRKVSYIDIVADKTIDISIYQILRQKKNIADIVTKDDIFDLTKGE